ncbi:hypothetical protein [Streptomyces halobius]|uniref:Lipoprotein n=1 Tax=Streptomyces halobius TaxID=2879846 RepID=A0ABY4MCL7_9ACTN|nr:hypothetical protein [Streptomyces halobius]UQA95525.1 hypothetical protein K9S39_30000 [Streptomyces halobius]
MRRILPVLFLTAAVLLTGCDFSGEARPSGPPTTTATSSQAGTELADRYRETGGDADVYGIDHTKNRKGVLMLSVWTHKKAGYKNFDDFATNLASFLTRQGIRLDQGYVLNVYGPDGTRLHNYDTTPEHDP